jgi:hypothetical protein
MKIKTAIAAISLCFGISAAVSAHEVVATGHGQRVALDFLNSGGASAFQFELAVPAGAKKVDASGCASELPATHSGACRYNKSKGTVTMMVYSTDNAELPKGLVPLGTVAISGAAIDKPAIGKLLISDAAGQPIATSNSRQLDAPASGPRGQKK